MRGGSIGDSFKEGYWGSISGCLSGGIFGGMLSGINALLLGGDFWTGENATIACYGTCVITDFSDEIVLGEELKYSSEYAEGFRSEYFSYVEDYTHVRHVYADNSLPPSKSIMNRMPRYIQKGDHVFSIKNGREVLGIASYLGSNLNLTDIYLYKSAFTSYEQLYLTMGHEFLHAALFTSSSYALSEELHHAMIYEWQYLQAKAWGFSKADYYENLYNTYAPGNWSALYHYSKFGFLVVSIQPWK
ncbi:MAG: hypothetical protein PHW83_13790 [Bacteroidales bacterium]|nr:hypothetical protein [Bacteroidales bacterium]